MPAKRDIKPSPLEAKLEYKAKINRRLVQEQTKAYETLARIDMDKLKKFSPTLHDIIEEAMTILIPF